MPQSMTGFARVQRSFDWGLLVCELRSVNHRYLDLHFRLSDSLKEAEQPIRALLKSKLSRGKVEVSVQYQINTEAESEFQIDPLKAKQFIQLLENVSSMMASPAKIDPFKVLQTPGVLRQQNEQPENFVEEAVSVCDEAVNALLAQREREGDELVKILMQRVEGIRGHVKSVRELVPRIRESQRQKLKDRLDEIAVELNEDRLEQELVIQAQKSDVDEEIDRLLTHLEEVERILVSDEPIGRRLDFLMQELNREANTLGSKSQAISTTNSAVEIKVLIEQMREQIQNIE